MTSGQEIAVCLLQEGMKWKSRAGQGMDWSILETGMASWLEQNASHSATFCCSSRLCGVIRRAQEDQTKLLILPERQEIEEKWGMDWSMQNRCFH